MTWMRKRHPAVPFARYADDIVAHCRTEKQAHYILGSIRRRLDALNRKIRSGALDGEAFYED